MRCKFGDSNVLPDLFLLGKEALLDDIIYNFCVFRVHPQIDLFM
jgi:hypothetical protein